MNELLREIRMIAFLYKGYWQWAGPENMKGYHLHVFRKDLMCLCAQYRVSRKQVQR